MNFHGHFIQAALFDMDGTMFDTERLRFQTLRQAPLSCSAKPSMTRCCSARSG